MSGWAGGAALPKIPGSDRCPPGRCIAFEKYDGTNLHWDWDRDFGWHSFGTRRDAFNLNPLGIEEFVRQHAPLRQCVEEPKAHSQLMCRTDPAEDE